LSQPENQGWLISSLSLGYMIPVKTACRLGLDVMNIGGISLLNTPTLHFQRTVIQCHIKISGNMQIWSRTASCYLTSMMCCLTHIR